VCVNTISVLLETDSYVFSKCKKLVSIW